MTTELERSLEERQDLIATLRQENGKLKVALDDVRQENEKLRAAVKQMYARMGEAANGLEAVRADHYDLAHDS